ncbi:hypothetical protein D0T92_09165 [Neisseria zalophi]|uniref:Uncharacterized protein n=1 Tax=Neisseria zalophi TaxID=640030 RepID=A0A5J6PWM4_9NEIS|nr:hypothetical protein D0T92_09165 [Neisseria zalophi]
MHIKIKYSIRWMPFLSALIVYTFFLIMSASAYFDTNLSNQKVPLILQLIIFLILSPGLVPLIYTYKVNSIFYEQKGFFIKFFSILSILIVIFYHFFVEVCLAHVYPEWPYWIIQVGEFLLAWLFIKIIYRFSKIKPESV